MRQKAEDWFLRLFSLGGGTAIISQHPWGWPMSISAGIAFMWFVGALASAGNSAYAIGVITSCSIWTLATYWLCHWLGHPFPSILFFLLTSPPYLTGMHWMARMDSLSD